MEESAMGRMSLETRLRVVAMWKKEWPLRVIQKRLQDEDIRVSIISLCKLTKNSDQQTLFVRYCALISDVNRAKRVDWCQERLRLNDLGFLSYMCT